MKTSEILEEAAMHIRKYGHAKGQLGIHGEPCCALGAVYAVTDNVYAPSAPPVNFLHRALEIMGVSDVAKWNDRPETTHGAAFNALWAAAKLARSEGQ